MNRLSFSERKFAFLAILFTFFLIVYFFCGICFSTSQIFEDDLLYGTDTTRAFLDLTASSSTDHYRIKVHPLFLILLQTVVRFVDVFLHHPQLSVILIESFCGSGCVVFFYLILNQFHVHRPVHLFSTLLFGFSFSTLLFSSIPESFIFSAFVSSSYWYFLLISIPKPGVLTRSEWFLLILFGIFHFGITITNYVPYCIGTVLLFYYRFPRHHRIRSFLLLNALNGIVILVLCEIQVFLWPHSPRFWHSILFNLLLGQGEYEEFDYMFWGFTLNKTALWIKQFFLCPIIYPNISVYPIQTPDIDRTILRFGKYTSLIPSLALILFYLFFAFCVVRYLTKYFIQSNHMERNSIVAICAALLFHVCLHYFYGASEAFLFSSHYLFLLLTLYAVTSDKLQISRSIPFSLITIVFSGIIISQNLYGILSSAFYALKLAGLSLSISDALCRTFRFALMAAACAGLLLLSLRIMAKRGKAVPEPSCFLTWLYVFYLIIVAGGVFLI